MAVDVATPFPRARTRPLARVAASPAYLALAVVVGVSAVLRSLLALFHSTAYYLPDEYLYPALARSLATTGRPLVRGGESNFPALLQPILTAPFQLFEDPELAYRLTQIFDSAAMSTAAIPVYLLARRLRLSDWYAIACGGLAVAAPSMVYAGFMLADPVAYPLALTAVYLAVRALDEPTRGAQFAFLGCAGLATFARTQYVILPFAFAAAALTLDRRRAFNAYRTTIVVLGSLAIAALALGPARVAGVYSAIGKADLGIASVLAWSGRDLALLAYAAGWVLVPGACVGLLVASGRCERAYARFVAFLAAALLVEAAVIAAIDSDRFQERYLMALVPLIPLAFGVYLRRGAPHRKLVAAIAVVLWVFSVRVPLSGYAAASGKDDSTLLTAARQLGNSIGVDNASLVIAVAAAFLSMAALGVVTLRRRDAGLVAVVLTALVLTAMSVGTYAFDRELAASVRTNRLPHRVRWVDKSGVRDAALLMLPNAEPQRSWHQLMWNREVRDVLLLGRRASLDGYASSRVRIAADGRILRGGSPIRRPLLVQTYGSQAEFTDATKVGSVSDFELWRPNGVPRFSVLAAGWYADGWIAWPATVSVWPDARGRVDGTLTLRLAVPANFARTTLWLKAPKLSRMVALAAGEARTIRISVTHAGRWRLKVTTPRPAVVDGRAVSVRGLPPVFHRGAVSARATVSQSSTA